MQLRNPNEKYKNCGKDDYCTRAWELQRKGRKKVQKKLSKKKNGGATTQSK